jgi:two-component system sensor histidine kinase HydH
MSKTKLDNRWALHTSPRIIIGSAVILLLVVVVLASHNYSREKKYMSLILSEKGAAVIRAVEAGTRTGMMNMQWGKQQVQALLEETAHLPGVLFLALVNPDGEILAHSDKSRIGTRLRQKLPIDESGSGKAVKWKIVTMAPYGSTFLVYSLFKPSHNPGGWMRHGGHHGMGMGKWRDGEEPSPQTGEDRIIIGIDPKPFYHARNEDIHNTLVISGILLLLGVTGFISMFWMHSYQSTRRKLQDTTAFANELAANLPVGLIATDRNGKIAYFNNAAERITGMVLSKSFGRDPRSLLPPSLCELREMLNRGVAIAEEEIECEFTEGKVVPVSVSAAQIVNEEDRFVGQVLILKDLGELRRLEAEIRRKEKLAAIGGLAAGVAHEIRNPLSSIKGIASYYRNKFADGSEDKEMAGVMIEEVDRLSRVISELLEFARPTRLNLKPSNLNDLLTHSVRLVQQEATAKNIRIRLTPAPDSPVAQMDPDRLTQSLLNLYLNAFQAMETGGELTITTGTTMEDGGKVTLDIRDNGSGIEAEALNQIFDPYFTTKPKGTGLGLAIVHKIVEAHQGTIKVRSTPGEGTVFSITLPLSSTA